MILKGRRGPGHPDWLLRARALLRAGAMQHPSHRARGSQFMLRAQRQALLLGNGNVSSSSSQPQLQRQLLPKAGPNWSPKAATEHRDSH